MTLRCALKFAVLTAFAASLAEAADISPGGTGTFGTVIYASGNHALSSNGSVATMQTSGNVFGTVASDGNDGNTDGAFANGSVFHTGGATAGAEFWRVNLAGNEYAIGSVTIFNRTDCCQSRLAVFDLEVINTATGTTDVLPQSVNPPAMNNNNVNGIGASASFPLPNNSIATDLQVTQQAAFSLHAAEVQVFGDSSLELSGDALNLEIGSGGSDFVDVEGAATLDGDLNVDFLTGTNPNAHDVFDLLTAATIDASLLNTTVTGIGGDYVLQTVDGGNGQILQLVLTPEPASIALWGMIAGIFGCGFYFRRRRS